MFNSNNMKKINYTAVFWVLTSMALIGGLALASQSQDTRRGAAFSAGRLMLLPNDKISFTVGQSQNVQLWVNSGNASANVDAIRTNICFNKNFLNLNDPVVENNIKQDPAFDTVIATLKDGNTQCLDLSILSVSKKASKNGLFKIADITFKGVGTGSGPIDIIKDKTEISGDNAGSLDKTISIDSVTGTTFEVTPQTSVAVPTTPPPAGTPLLSFRFAYAGVKANAECSIGAKWPVKIMVRGNGKISKAYTAIPTLDGTNSRGEAVYKVTNLALTDFDQKSGLAVFLKGPEHAQMKYGVNAQASNYTKADGEITITADASTTPILDFTNYPIMPGDVRGSASGGQDGIINVVDFSYIKQAVSARSTVPAGGGLDADLNGDCMANTGDVQLFKNSLIEKQDQLY